MTALLQITTNEYHQFGPLFATVPIIRLESIFQAEADTLEANGKGNTGNIDFSI